MAKIFLSHSHADEKLAHVLEEQIRTELELSIGDIFVSSKPNSIENGEWAPQVHEKLNQVQAFIPLITTSSEKSTWVAFECGSFWARSEGTNIFPLRHPKTDLSTNPLNPRQFRLITNHDHLEKFFDDLCGCFDRPFKRKADLDVIVQSALKTPTLTSTDLQFQMICKLQLITAPNVEVKNAIFKWMNDQDILHDAQFAWMGDFEGVHLKFANMQRINLGGNILRGASFWRSNLEDALLGSTQLQFADFSHVSSLVGASFQGAQMDMTTTLPDGNGYIEELGLEQLLKFGAVIDR